MQTYTPEQLTEILEQHKIWLKDQTKGKRANLQGANLQGANLQGANLQGANLWRANLWRANLQGAYLRGAYLQWANLQGANLQEANLQGANLQWANLWEANLQGADLQRANLQRANLQGADLRWANLQGVDLQDCRQKELALAQTKITQDGTIIGWKKSREGYIIKLQIPEKSKRSNATGRKCRCEYAKVLDIIGGKQATSFHDKDFIYKIGKTVRCDKWEENRFIECGGGIHFFITREEAENYEY